VYTTDDVIGIELGGSPQERDGHRRGRRDGLGFGHNTRAAIVTRGLAELSRLAIKLGAHPMTLAGLGGSATSCSRCTATSRATARSGSRLAAASPLSEILGSMNEVAEGVRTTKSAYELSRREA